MSGKICNNCCSNYQYSNYCFKAGEFLSDQVKEQCRKALKVSGTTNGITENELLTIVDEAEQVGGLDSNESELIHNVIPVQ